MAATRNKMTPMMAYLLVANGALGGLVIDRSQWCYTEEPICGGDQKLYVWSQVRDMPEWQDLRGENGPEAYAKRVFNKTANL